MVMTYGIDLRRQAVSQVHSGMKKISVCRLFGIHRTTLDNWLQSDDLTPEKHGSRHRKIDKSALSHHVRQHPDMFLRERAAIFDVSINAISVALRTLKLVKKNADL